MKKYTILKGFHYSRHWISLLLFPKKVKFDFILNNKSAYRSLVEHDDIATRQLKYQVNKIAGLSFDLLGNNSARLGYRYNWEKDVFQVLPYYHIDGKRIWNDEKAVDIDKGVKYTCRIRKDKNRCLFTVSNKYTHKVLLYDTINMNTSSILGYKQYPYFGGSGIGSKAPKNIEILLKFN